MFARGADVLLTLAMKAPALPSAQKSLIFRFVSASDPGFVARTVRAARMDAGLTQVGLAEAAGLRRETVSRLERGRGAHADTLARIAGALGITSDRFLERRDFSCRLYGHPRRTPIRDLRRSLGLTLGECAQAAGVSAATLSRFERGNEHYPSICTVGRMTRATGIHNDGLARALGFPDADALSEHWLQRR